MTASDPGLPTKEARALAKWAKAQGWDVRLTAKGHLRFEAPGRAPVIAPTKFDAGGRLRANTRAKIIRAEKGTP